ncbi:helix-turn-helix transcriptional regulator [Paenibacillus sp. TRM 82003]|nr:helix-turn-helix transcriptional regulator [Paenibacillus sp. TRM 82003]
MATNVAEVNELLKSQIKIRIAEYEIKTGDKFVKKDAAKALGMNPQNFSSLVAGTVYTTAEKMFKLARMLNCKVDDLYILEDEE